MTKRSRQNKQVTCFVGVATCCVACICSMPQVFLLHFLRATLLSRWHQEPSLFLLLDVIFAMTQSGRKTRRHARHGALRVRKRTKNAERKMRRHARHGGRHGHVHGLAGVATSVQGRGLAVDDHSRKIGGRVHGAGRKSRTRRGRAHSDECGFGVLDQLDGIVASHNPISPKDTTPRQPSCQVHGAQMASPMQETLLLTHTSLLSHRSLPRLNISLRCAARCRTRC